MNKKDVSDYRRKYDMARHHAWAGTVLLSVLLALRIFLEISMVSNIPDPIILSVGVILIVYTLIALFFTYKYRPGLSVEQKVLHVHPSDEVEREKIKAKVEKERLKVEKKKVKAEAKRKSKKPSEKI